MRPPASGRRLRALGINGALAAASLALCLAAIEAGARVMARDPPPSAPSGRPISRFHPLLGWDKPPGGGMRITRGEYDVTIEINSKGLRGPERDYPKPPGHRRVLLLGDSFAEGYYVEEPSTARALLEAGLDQGGRCGTVEVINGGTAGYSTDQEYLFFQNEGWRYEADLVVVFFYYNDLYYNTVAIGTGGKGKPYFELVDGKLALRNSPVPAPDPAGTGAPPADRPQRVLPWKGSVALRMLGERLAVRPRLHGFFSRLGLVPPLRGEPSPELWPYGVAHNDEVAEMWRTTGALIGALRETVEARGGRLALLYVPSRFELGTDDDLGTIEGVGPARRVIKRQRVFERLRRTCEELHLPLLDPRESLRRSEAAGERAYFPRDGHWNERGNAIAARELVSFAERALGCEAGRP